MIENKIEYPYADTIYIIEKLLELLDVYLRNVDKYSPYYHNFRYRYICRCRGICK